MKTIAAALFLTCALGIPAHADTVVFKNGDKLTGTLVEIQAGNLKLKSDVLGDVTVPMAKVQTFSVDKPAVVLGKDQKVVRGQIALQESGDWTVTANGSSQTLPGANVTVVMPADVYHAIAEVPSRPWQLWKGSANLGYSFQHGDQQTGTLSGLIIASRERPSDLLFTPHLRTDYGLTLLFSKAQQDGESVTSDTISSNLRLDYLFTPRNFVYGFGQVDHIQAQGLYLRQTLGAGVGRDLIHSGRTLFSVLAGVNYMHEKLFSGRSDASAEGLIGEKLGMQITPRLRLDHQVNIYPNLQRGIQYHADSSTNLAFKFNSHITANAGVIDLFLNDPAPGSHQNNIAVTTGLGYIF